MHRENQRPQSYYLCLTPNFGSAYSAQVTLVWDANTDPNLAGYRIHYGLLSDQYSSSIDAGNRTSYTLSNFEDGKIDRGRSIHKCGRHKWQ
jgi:hypothetical protein